MAPPVLVVDQQLNAFSLLSRIFEIEALTWKCSLKS